MCGIPSSGLGVADNVCAEVPSTSPIRTPRSAGCAKAPRSTSLFLPRPRRRLALLPSPRRSKRISEASAPEAVSPTRTRSSTSPCPVGPSPFVRPPPIPTRLALLSNPLTTSRRRIPRSSILDRRRSSRKGRRFSALELVRGTFRQTRPRSTRSIGIFSPITRQNEPRPLRPSPSASIRPAAFAAFSPPFLTPLPPFARLQNLTSIMRRTLLRLEPTSSPTGATALAAAGIVELRARQYSQGCGKVLGRSGTSISRRRRLGAARSVQLSTKSGSAISIEWQCADSSLLRSRLLTFLQAEASGFSETSSQAIVRERREAERLLEGRDRSAPPIRTQSPCDLPPLPSSPSKSLRSNPNIVRPIPTSPYRQHVDKCFETRSSGLVAPNTTSVSGTVRVEPFSRWSNDTVRIYLVWLWMVADRLRRRRQKLVGDPSKRQPFKAFPRCVSSRLSVPESYLRIVAKPTNDFGDPGDVFSAATPRARKVSHPCSRSKLSPN